MDVRLRIYLPFRMLSRLHFRHLTIIHSTAALLALLLLFPIKSALAQNTQSGNPTPPPASAAQNSKLTPSETQVVDNVSPPKLLYETMPKYPRAAKAAHIEGTVVLKVIIKKDGTTSDLQFVSGPPELENAAIDAVKKWRYKPRMLNGEPAEAHNTVSVVFTLH
jgi:TonB family protein